MAASPGGEELRYHEKREIGRGLSIRLAPVCCGCIIVLVDLSLDCEVL